ncbi:MAG: hypothetical protein ACK559_33850, partial [bacterium]
VQLDLGVARGQIVADQLLVEAGQHPRDCAVGGEREAVEPEPDALEAAYARERERVEDFHDPGAVVGGEELVAERGERHGADHVAVVEDRAGLGLAGERVDRAEEGARRGLEGEREAVADEPAVHVLLGPRHDERPPVRADGHGAEPGGKATGVGVGVRAGVGPKVEGARVG